MDNLSEIVMLEFAGMSIAAISKMYDVDESTIVNALEEASRLGIVPGGKHERVKCGNVEFTKVTYGKDLLRQSR